MADKYDPIPDLAELLASVIAYRSDAHVYADRIASRLGLAEDDSAEAAAEVLRKALGLKACRCVISGGELLPLACPVHGTPCEYCGGLESCAEDCGGGASEYQTVDLIPDRYRKLVKVASAAGEVVVLPPPEAGALFFGPEGRDRFARAWAEAERRAEAWEAEHGEPPQDDADCRCGGDSERCPCDANGDDGLCSCCRDGDCNGSCEPVARALTPGQVSG